MIHIGTSGYSYDDWVGPVYPPRTRKADFLSKYKELFSACELNFTYYRLPTARTMEGILNKSAGQVLFTVKASREMTHERHSPSAAVSAFKEGIQPLMQAGRLGAILVQFPFSLHVSPNARTFVERLVGGLEGLSVVIEFRGQDWIFPETFEWLRRIGAGFCCVDEPRLKELIAPSDQVTSDIGYVRFHGRNAQKWWRHQEAAERYDYLYSQQELQEWVPRILKMEQQTQEVFVFTNNHFQGKAVSNAKQLEALLGLAKNPSTPAGILPTHAS